MKRDMDKLNLRSAFGPEPEDCHTALMAAACSVKEERTMRKGFRTVALAAIFIVCMMAAAFAAGQSGLLDWLRLYASVQAPQTAQEVLAATKQTTYEVGPLTMTVSETLADGRLVYLTVKVSADGGNALVFSDDPEAPIGQAVANALNDPDITANTPLTLAAQKTGLPLYMVGAWLQPEKDVSTGEEMMDCQYLEGGELLLIDMLRTNPDQVAESLQVDIYMRVRQVDPVTMEVIGDAWQTVEQRNLTIHGVTNQRTYLPEGEMILNEGLTIQSAKAELTCAGVYVTILAELRNGMTYEELLNGGYAVGELLDENGQPLPDGISMSGAIAYLGKRTGTDRRYDWRRRLAGELRHYLIPAR